MKKALLFLLFSYAIIVQAQNCSVNADIDKSICRNQPMLLTGSRSGLLKLPATTTWSQVAGPSVTITNPNTLNTTVTGFSANQTYTFRLSTTCRDGVKIFDDVRITVLPITTANAGPDQTACPGSSTLAANSPGVNETGQWSIVGSNNAGVIINNSNSATSTFSTAIGSAGQTTLRWTITNTNLCFTSDDVVITNYGGRSPVSTRVNLVNLGNCYSTTQCYKLNATFGGNGFGGQIGTWSQVSGPSNVTFTSLNDSGATVCGLSTGCYKLKWTVSGPCVNSSDTIRICVPPPTQSVTTASSSNQIFCDGRTVALLTGNTPINTGETVQWTQTSGPTAVTFSNATSPITSVSNLNGTGTYNFTYTITNPLTGCQTSISVSISYVAAPSITGLRDTLLPCNITASTFSFNATGGNSTTYRIISAPEAWGITPTTATTVNSPLSLSGLTTAGTYIVRLTRTTTNGVGCLDFNSDFRVIVSRTPLGANAGTPQFIPCGDSFTYLAGNVPGRGFGTWTQVSGPAIATIDSINNPNSYVYGLYRGTYVFRWIVDAGPKCPKAQSDVRVTFAPTVPQAVTAGSPRTICYGSTINLSANAPAQGETGVWSVSPSSGVTFGNVNSPTSSVSGLAANTAYTFKWKVSNLCGADSSTVVITTNNSQGPPLANAGPDRCLSSGTTSLTLAGNNPSPAKGVWTLISGPAVTFANDSLYNTNITGLTNGTYLLEWKNIRGTCDPTRDTVMITISAAATISNAGSNVDSCSNSFTFSGNTPTVGIGTWTQVSGPAGWSISNPNSPNAKLTSLVSGEYKFAWVISNGACASNSDTITFNIDNLPTAPYAGLSQKLCGSNSLTLDGNKVNNGFGIWSLVGAAPNSPTITNPDDSSALVTNLITGIYQFRWTVYSNYGVCPTQYSEVFDTVVISSNAGTDQNLCFQSTTSLLGPVGSLGTWTQTIGTSATVTTTSTNSAIVTNMSPSGSPYKFAYTVPTRWGCPQTTDTMTVVISDTTNVPNAGPDQSFCNATGFTLAGNNVSPNTAVWQQIFGTSTTITTPTSNTSTVTGLGYGIFLYRWTVTNGSCSRSDEVRITNNEAPTISNAGADTTICPSRVKMRANTAAVGVGNWRQVSGPSTAIIEEPVNPKTIISDLTSVGTYKFVWEISNGAVCPPSIDTIYVLVPFLNPTTAYAGLDSAICVRTATQLNGNSISIGTGNWSQYTVSPTSTISNASLNNSGLSLTTSGVYGYVWTATNGSCVSRDTVVYTLSDLPITSNAGPKINSCIGQPVILAANNASPNIGTWRQISGPFTVGFSDSNSRNSSVLGIDTGTYILRWQITSGSCPASNSFDTIVIVKLPAIAIAGGFQSLCGSSTTLTGSVDSIGTGLWSFVNGPNTPTIVSPTTETTAITGLTNGNYRFRWAITNGGCVSQDTVLITYVMPMINNACSSADSIYANGGLNSGIDSLCASTAEVGEPATCGKPACNSNMYKFVTNNTLWWQTVTFNFTISGNPCPGGLRVSCFNSGACPGLGSQMGTCQALSGSGGTVSFLLAPNTLYYLVVDDNSASCGTSNCRYSFTAAGNALPINYFEINASLINNNLSKIEWQVIEDDKNINYTLERKLEQENVFKTIAKIKSNGVIGIMENYNYLDNISSFNNTPIYYRIKYENEKNDIKYSKTVKLQKNIGGINSISIFPNPSTSIFNLNINVNEESTIKYTISNAVGKVIQSNTLELNNGLNTQLINLSSYDKGIYFVTIENEFVKNTIKIMLIE